jgi:hypothetical protein
MCTACQRDFDRQVAKDGTTMGLIAWAASRGRKFGRLDQMQYLANNGRLLGA